MLLGSVATGTSTHTLRMQLRSLSGHLRRRGIDHIRNELGTIAQALNNSDDPGDDVGGPFDPGGPCVLRDVVRGGCVR